MDTANEERAPSIPRPAAAAHQRWRRRTCVKWKSRHEAGFLLRKAGGTQRVPARPSGSGEAAEHVVGLRLLFGRAFAHDLLQQFARTFLVAHLFVGACQF